MTEPTTDPTESEDTATDTTEEQPTAEPPGPPPEPDQPAYRSLDWWKSKANEHKTTAETIAAERDQLRTRVDALQRQQIESLLTGKLHNVRDFWHHAPPVSELLDESGNVDATKVNAARAEMVRSAPYLAPSAAAPASMVTANNAIDYDGKGTQTFGELLKAAARGRGIASE